MSAKLPSTEQIFTETSRLVPLWLTGSSKLESQPPFTTETSQRPYSHHQSCATGEEEKKEEEEGGGGGGGETGKSQLSLEA